MPTEQPDTGFNQRNTALLEMLFQSVPLALCLVDGSGRVVLANQNYLNTFAISASDLALKTRAEIEDDHLEPIHSDGENSKSGNHYLFSDGQVYERYLHPILEHSEQPLSLVMWFNITRHDRMRAELNHQLSLFQTLSNLLPDQLFFKDREHRYTQVNDSFLAHRGLADRPSLEQLSDEEILAEESLVAARKEEQKLFQSGEPIINHLRQEILRTGERVWNQYTKMPIFSPEGEITGLFGFATDVTEKKRSEQLIWRQANYDHLTQLPNRRLLADRWHSAWQAHLRDKKWIGLLLVDLDGFKLINDSKGHQAGEGVLVSVAERLRRCTRGKDTVARMSADEFAILATDIKEDADLDVVIKKVLRQFEEPFLIDREEVMIATSIGVAVAPRDANDLETLMMHADQALHEAKRAGGSTFKVFSAELHETASRQFTLANDIRYALLNREFTLNFQPIIDLSSGRPVKVETLIRWHHLTRGWISPSEFIPVAERTGQIIQIGDWVFREAIRAVSRVTKETGKELRISINVSPRQLQHAQFDAQEWLDYVVNQGFALENLVIEITEGLFMDPDERVLQSLDTFSKNGVKISLDDFGTGYASISFLENFEIDVLKLDQAFVRDSERSPKRRVLSEAIINMAKALEFEIIAEGIETEDQAQWVTAAGCQYGQGYFFSKPLNEDRLAEYLLKSE